MENIVALILIIFGTILGCLILWKIFDIVRNSIKKNKGKYDEDRFDRLAKAFITHKKDMDRRVQYIEAIITEEESASIPSSQEKIEPSASHKSIEVDSKDPVEIQRKPSRRNLKNDLNKKRTT